MGRAGGPAFDPAEFSGHVLEAVLSETSTECSYVKYGAVSRAVQANLNLGLDSATFDLLLSEALRSLVHEKKLEASHKVPRGYRIISPAETGAAADVASDLPAARLIPSKSVVCPGFLRLRGNWELRQKIANSRPSFVADQAGGAGTGTGVRLASLEPASDPLETAQTRSGTHIWHAKRWPCSSWRAGK
jgi:hypothetical protein